MERNTDQVEEKSNILEPDFGGHGPRQILGAALKDVEHFTDIFVVAMSKDKALSIYHNEMSPELLALLSMKIQGYTMMVANDWEEPE